MKQHLLLAVASLCIFSGCSKKEDAATPPSSPAPALPAATPASPAPAEKMTSALTNLDQAGQKAASVIAGVQTNAQEKARDMIGQLSGALQKATNMTSATTPVSPDATTPVTIALPASLADLSTDQVVQGLKEALGKGLDQAIASLGKTDGFLKNADVKIPMPAKLQSVEKTLRAIGQDKIADDFITTMNQAAEQAVPAAAEVFATSLKNMSVEDAKGILNGQDDAATQFFRRTTGDALKQKFLPIVQQATAKSGATAAYKNLMDKAKIASPFLNSTTAPVDLDGYVADKALDGLFKMVAAEEKRIRQNPLARSTDLLKSVFGALKH